MDGWSAPASRMCNEAFDGTTPVSRFLVFWILVRLRACQRKQKEKERKAIQKTSQSAPKTTTPKKKTQNELDKTHVLYDDRIKVNLAFQKFAGSSQSGALRQIIQRLILPNCQTRSLSLSAVYLTLLSLFARPREGKTEAADKNKDVSMYTI